MTSFTRQTSIQENISEFVFFFVEKKCYALNIAKVKEIISLPSLRPVPYAHRYLKGIFDLRGKVLPLVDLKLWLGLTSEYEFQSRVIIVEFLGIEFGIQVDRVERIYRLKWELIESAEALQPYSPLIIATIKLNEQLIALLDFEELVLEIRPDLLYSRKKKQTEEEIKAIRNDRKIWIAEDSSISRQNIESFLSDAGFSKLRFFNDGQQLLNNIQITADDQLPDLIISDIEMPRLDGFSLAMIVKNDQRLKKIPLILISAVVESQIKVKKELVKADALLAKQELEQLDTIIDTFFSQEQN